MENYSICDIINQPNDRIPELPVNILEIIIEDEKRNYYTPIVQCIPYEKWNYFTEEMLAHLSQKALQYLNEDALNLLLEKFKDSKKTFTIQKLSGITIEVQPISRRIKAAKRTKRNLRKECVKAKEARELIQLYNSEDENSLIPLYILQTAYMLTETEIMKYFKDDLVDKDILYTGINDNLKEKIEMILPEQENIAKIECISKRNLIEVLENASHHKRQLTYIPDIINRKEVLFNCELEYMNRLISNNIYTFLTIMQYIQTYKFQHILYNREDFYKLVAYIP